MNYIKMLKHIYQLEGKKVEWGLIEEISYEQEVDFMEHSQPADKVKEMTYKPGVYIKGSRVYVDLLARRFYSTVNLQHFARKIHRARWKAIKGGYVAIESRDFPDKYIVLGRHFIEDVYCQTVYGEWMEERLLL